MLKKEYWVSSAQKLKDIKFLTIMALFIALKVIVEASFDLKVSENLFVSLSFLFQCVEACMIGPVAGLVSGFVTDVLSFILNSKGYPFFAGYTLSAMLSMLIYALFFYHQKITILRIIAAKTINNYLVHVVIGSIWSKMLMSKGYLYYFTQSLIKNTILLPFEIIALVILFNALIPVLQSKKLITAQNPLPLKWK